MGISLPMGNMPAMLGRVVPWVLAAIFAVAAVAILWDGARSKPEGAEENLWKPPPSLLNVAMPLPERVLQELEGVEKGDAPKRRERRVARVAPKREQMKLPPPPTRKAKPATPTAPPKVVEGSRFIVQVGSFVYAFGAEKLVERLHNHGYKAAVIVSEEMVNLNQVQAGPYGDLESAKEAELKLRAGGLPATIEKSWEGLIVTIGESMMLGQAISMMEQSERLYVHPLRLMKVEAPQKLSKVVLGPYAKQKRAKSIAGSMSELGMMSPLIKVWEGGELEPAWKEDKKR
uniref:SPOR domain-containing protein n=1 Tax=Magnetococcus massalia (strain MO-1) TaxID=451514 RepID=A0A1S7LHE2_MAGMO|nr:Conserved protein of unknown function. Containing sporulation domain [Candidatus Magnetococcus massalia]